MKQIRVIGSISLLYIIFLQLSCRHDPITPFEDAPSISFSKDVLPVLISNCTQSGCHGSKEFALNNYNDIMSHVTAGKAHSSSLYSAITSNAGNVMPVPPNPRLSDMQIKQIYIWIEQGAKDN